MNLVQINVVCNGSTGKIMCDIAKEANKYKFNTYCFYGRGLPNKDVECIRIGNKLSVYFHVLLARLGFNGHGSYFATKKLIKRLRKINPDVIHLHNIHGYYVNLKVLFKYLKNEYTGKIVWTLHDCWAFTGHCSYFTMKKCNKWQTQCKNCPQLNCYPSEWCDTTYTEYRTKKELFAGLNNLTLITPSEWLKKLVKQSFLKDYQTNVINNGIDIKVFKHTYDTGIYDRYNIPKNKKIILGVANVWEERKGLIDFIELSKIIDDNYTIVLVGIDKKTRECLPNNIITIPRTSNQSDLAALYTISTIFFNPTYEDNYPTTNLESAACKTNIVCYDTGGCAEQIKKFNSGLVIKKGSLNSFMSKLNELNNKPRIIKNLDYIGIDKMTEKYIKLYKN